MIYKGQHKISYFSGESSTYTLTSSYTTIAEVPGTARNLIFEVYLAPTTGTLPVDLRLMQAMPRLDAQTSDLNYGMQTTVYTQKTSSFTFSTGKGAYMFAAQIRQSTNSTAVGTAQIKWMGIS
jgi:hypothetical protein